jgi:hypothetical protein
MEIKDCCPLLLLSCVRVIEAWAAISFEENSGRHLISYKFLEDRLVGIVELFADTLQNFVRFQVVILQKTVRF